MAWGALVALVLLGQTIARASRPGGIDVTSYLLSARALLHGASPYLLPTPFPYLYPPTLAFLLIPLTFVPPIAALVAWFALNAGAVMWAVDRVARAVRPDLVDRRDDFAVLLAVFFTIVLPIVQSNLRNGQVNFVVLALCVAAAVPDTRASGGETRGRFSTPGGALLWSLSVALKVMPSVLLPYFALRRRWPWMLQAVMFCAALLLLPAFVLNEQIFNVYRQYRDVMQAASFGIGADALDFSLAATTAVLTGTALTPALRISAAAAVLGWILQADGRRLHHEDVRPLSLYLLAIPLVSPKSEVHHLAFALPAAAIVAAGCWRPRHWNLNGTGTIAIPVAAALYAAALTSPMWKGPMYCLALISTAVAVMHLPAPNLDTVTSPAGRRPVAEYRP
jgi:glycosyl transferase family 87